VHLVGIGLSHKTAPVEVRERLSFGPGNLGEGLADLHRRSGVQEAVLLCTCNRTEAYAVGAEAEPAATAFLIAHSGLSADALSPHLYLRTNQEAVAHLFRVAAGVDSMVVGESEILGQVKRALEAALAQGCAGLVLDRLFRTAAAVGKRARAETGIGRGAFSVGHCAAELARSIFSDLHEKRLLLLGAGDTAELTARHLMASGATSVFVANRTHARALELAEQLGGRAVHYDELLSAMEKCDIVIGATAAPHAVVTRDQVAQVMRARKNRPLFCIDIAVPRDIEPAVGTLNNVYLYDIDDLSAVVAEDAQQRSREAEKVEAIVLEATGKFSAWHQSLRAAPTIAALRQKLEGIRAGETERALRRLEHLSAQDREAVVNLTTSLLNKILHQPTVELKNGLRAGDGEVRIETVRCLFGLDEGETEET